MQPCMPAKVPLQSNQLFLHLQILAQFAVGAAEVKPGLYDHLRIWGGARPPKPATPPCHNGIRQKLLTNSSLYCKGAPWGTAIPHLCCKSPFACETCPCAQRWLMAFPSSSMPYTSSGPHVFRAITAAFKAWRLLANGAPLHHLKLAIPLRDDHKRQPDLVVKPRFLQQQALQWCIVVFTGYAVRPTYAAPHSREHRPPIPGKYGDADFPNP